MSVVFVVLQKDLTKYSLFWWYHAHNRSKPGAGCTKTSSCMLKWNGAAANSSMACCKLFQSGWHPLRATNQPHHFQDTWIYHNLCIHVWLCLLGNKIHSLVGCFKTRISCWDNPSLVSSSLWQQACFLQKKKKKRSTLSDIFSGSADIISCSFRFVGFMFPSAINLPHKKHCAFCVPLHLRMKAKSNISKIQCIIFFDISQLKLDTQRRRSTVP
jgi:hypothetical protein